MTNLRTSMFSGLSALLLLSACSHMPGAAQRVENDFGNSVRHMIQVQSYDYYATEHAESGIPDGFDGDKAAKAMEGYRDPAAQDAQVDPVRLVID